MSECIIEGSVEVTHTKQLLQALEKQNELLERQNMILAQIVKGLEYIRMGM